MLTPSHRPRGMFSVFAAVALLLITGCASPYRADRGALFGGLTGAGVGALVGNATGNTGAGAAIGAGVGALSGAAVGAELDSIEAQNRAEIEARLGQPLATGSVSLGEVIEMSKAGVDDHLIANHIRANGFAGPLTSNDLIMLQQQGVGSDVVQAMQQSPRVAAAPPAPVPVIVEERYAAPYWGPYWYPPPYRPYGRPGFSWGLSFHH